jgi:hypothetical protein
MPAFRRKPLPAPLQAKTEARTFLAPIRGWIASESLAREKPGGASVLENFFPTTRGIMPRGGKLRHATITDGVDSLLAWRSGTTERLFAADQDSIYNVTAPADPDVQPSADVTGQTSGVYSSTMFSTTGGDFLVAVNGTDDHLVYDGSAWAVNTPAITGVDSDDFSYVWVFKNRLFFIQKNTMYAWALEVDSLGGAATQISLSGVFKRGGILLFGTAWSVDAGDGMDDLCAFVTTLGEVAIFAGSDPADPTDWSLVGTYDIGTALGPFAHFKAGGDVIIATLDGLVPLSAAQNKDPAALTLAAVTQSIETEWHTQALARRSSTAWSCVKWVARNMAIIGLPTVGSSDTYCYVVNLLTGAWAKYTGWDMSCSIELGSRVYFGEPGGGVFLAEAAGEDDGEQYLSTYIGVYEHLKAPANTKVAKMARTTWLYRRPFIDKVSFQFNYIADLPAYPSAAAHADEDLWDVAEWDVALWDASGADAIVTEWRSVAGQGFAVAPAVQMTHSYSAPPEAELVSVDLLYEMGGVAV